jgi:hypothetical protein
MSSQITNESNNQYLSAAYSELCNSYHKIDDFRQKLLAALPLASGTGIYFLAGSTDKSALMSIFGFMVTLGLLIFEVHGIRRCTHIIALGKFLESEMKIEGHFSNRCSGLRSVGNDKAVFARLINEPLAASFIYPAVLGGWIYLSVFSLSNGSIFLATFVAITTFGIIFYKMWKFNIWLVDTDFGEKLDDLEKSKKDKSINTKVKDK